MPLPQQILSALTDTPLKTAAAAFCDAAGHVAPAAVGTGEIEAS